MIAIAPGRYVVAVSGGVDSMVLLDMVRQLPGLDIVVAHADHGQRADSPQDESLIIGYCRRYGLTCVSEKLKLSSGASEAAAREKRWEFLRRCSTKYRAQAIITAHHQDDLIETALIALSRGTGWRGLAPFTVSPGILRPLLNYTKDDIISYARRHAITWREDTTNADERYLRNYMRHTVIPMLDQKSDSWRSEFLQQIRKQQKLRLAINKTVDMWWDAHIAYPKNSTIFERYFIIMLDTNIAYELLQAFFVRITGNTLERHLAESALLFIKTALPGKKLLLGPLWQLRATTTHIVVETQ